MVPTWLTAVAWVYISICLVCAGAIAYDIVFNRRRQPMGVMNWVFPITALYFGPFVLWLYWRWARVAAPPVTAASHPSVPAAAPASTPQMATVSAGCVVSGRGDEPARDEMDHGGEHEPDQPPEPARPGWVTMAIEVSHCGSGCTLGDFISEWIIFALGLTIAGYALFAEYIGDYILAVSFGIVFQYFAIAPMRGLGFRLRSRPVRLDGPDDVHLLSGAASPDARFGRLLVSHADRHDQSGTPPPGRPTSGSSGAVSRCRCRRWSRVGGRRRRPMHPCPIS